MAVDTLSFQRATLLNQSGAARSGGRPATHPSKNHMHSILLVIPRPGTSKPGIEQVWQTVVPGLQLCAEQVRGVKTLCENCWLIPAEENGFSFFDHAITIADSVNLRCRICLLRTPPDGFAPRSPDGKRQGLSEATVHAFQGMVRWVLKRLASLDPAQAESTNKAYRELSL